MASAMSPAVLGSGTIMGFGLLVLSGFVLWVTAYKPEARDSDTWKALATAIIMTGLLGFTAFVQQALQRQQEHDLQAAIDDAEGDATPVIVEPTEP